VVWKKNELHPPLDFEQKKQYLKARSYITLASTAFTIAITAHIPHTYRTSNTSMTIRTASTAAYFYGFFFFPLSSVGTC
jgi:hypothetical protein